MACLDKETDISVHKGHGHSDVLAVRQDGTSVSPSFLDETKNIIPSKNRTSTFFSFYVEIGDRRLPSTVESSRMIPQFKKDLLHVESSWESFNKNCRANCVVGHADIGLRKYENIIPETSFEIVFHFGEVEVWSESTLDKLMCIVVKV